MNILLLLVNSLLLTTSDTITLVPNLEAFTHPEFFYSTDCKCGMFNSDFFQLEIYNTPYMPANSTIIPPNFEVGYSVIITGKQDDFFRIKFNEEENPVYSQCEDCDYYVKKGTLGTWIYNINDTNGEYEAIPIYKEPNTNSKVVANLKKENSVVIILDVQGEWMFVETITGKRKRGWLNPKMQCGDPYGRCKR
ncbi:MAG: hypothetical protein LBO06_07655 [Bacteroidales bacterium]|jgi:hypothetical protein|nr:hypothetical protein [Bacteroidales bacterium]